MKSTCQFRPKTSVLSHRPECRPKERPEDPQGTGSKNSTEDRNTQRCHDRFQLPAAKTTHRREKSLIEGLIREISRNNSKRVAAMLRKGPTMRALGQMGPKDLTRLLHRCDDVPAGRAANRVYQALQRAVATTYLNAFATDVQLLLARPIREIERHLREPSRRNEVLALMQTQPEQFVARLNSLGIEAESAQEIRRSGVPSVEFTLRLADSRRALDKVGHLARNMLHDDSHIGYLIDGKPLANRARQLLRDFRPVAQRTRQRLGIDKKSAASGMIGQLLVRGKEMQRDAQLRKAILKTTLAVVASIGGFGAMSFTASVAYGAATTTLDTVPELLIKSEKASMLRKAATVGLADDRRAAEAEAERAAAETSLLHNAISGGAVGGATHGIGHILGPTADQLLKGTEAVHNGKRTLERNLSQNP
jgi:hypothetical protein